jgi:AcrR family transcriptional regulator
MGSKERRERQKENMRQEILDAARELFLQEGYNNVSMRKIAERIEYSPTTIYLYFQDKDEILFNLCEETFAKLVAALQQIDAAVADPLECLHQCLSRYVDFGLQHPNHYRITFLTETVEEDPNDYLQEGTMGLRAYSHLHNNVQRCIDHALFRLTDADTITQSLWAAVHGVTALLILYPQFPWVDRRQLIDQLITATIAGFAISPATLPPNPNTIV